MDGWSGRTGASEFIEQQPHCLDELQRGSSELTEPTGGARDNGERNISIQGGGGGATE